jgi:tetratricopeptide (TPR) repeat protein
MKLIFYAAIVILTAIFCHLSAEVSEQQFKRVVDELRETKIDAKNEIKHPKKSRLKPLVYEEKIFNFYSAINNSINKRIDVKDFESALWFPNNKNVNTNGLSIFISPQKVIESLSVLKSFNDSEATKNKGLAIFILESGNGPVKLSSGISVVKSSSTIGEAKKQYFFQKGGPNNTSWSIYIDSKRHQLFPLDSVYELATLSLSQPKDLFDYVQKRSDIAGGAISASRVFADAANINSHLSYINKTYNYSSDASMAMAGLSAFSALIALASSGSGVNIENQIENLPNYISFFAHPLESGDHVTQIYCFSEQKKVIYSKRVIFKIQPSKPTFIFISKEIPEMPDTGAIINNYIWTYHQTNGSTKINQITPSIYDVGGGIAGRDYVASAGGDDELNKVIETGYKMFNGVGGLKQSREEAIALLKNNLEKNRPKIHYHLGQFYLSIGDKAKAIESYREASVDGDLASMSNYGLSLLSDGKTEAIREAIGVLGKNAELGVPHSCFILGAILSDDTKPYFNRDAGMKNYEKAAFGGISAAAEMLELQTIK